MILRNEKLGIYAELTAYLHEPDHEMENIEQFPSILVLPGGGFRFCSSREGEPVAMSYFAQGFQAFVLKYTTVTDKPDAVIGDPMEDVQNALTFIRSHAEELHVAAGQVTMIGFSGGAHLAAAVATHGPERPDLLLLGYPGILHSELRALECPDIIECVDEKTPATYIFSDYADTVTPPAHALAFASALDAAKREFEIHIFHGGVHGMSLATSFTCSGDKSQVDPAFAQWFPMSVDWLKAKFGDFVIYGVNDGRAGKMNIDCFVKDLLANEKAAAILKEMLPQAEQIVNSPFGARVTPRMMANFVPDIDKAKLQELDQALLAL